MSASRIKSIATELADKFTEEETSQFLAIFLAILQKKYGRTVQPKESVQ